MPTRVEPGQPTQVTPGYPDTNQTKLEFANLGSYRTISVIRSRRYCTTSGILYFEYGYLCDLIPRLRPQPHQPAKSKKQGAHAIDDAGVLLYSPAKSISSVSFYRACPVLDVGSHNPTRRMADDDLPQTIREALSTAFPKKPAIISREQDKWTD